MPEHIRNNARDRCEYTEHESNMSSAGEELPNDPGELAGYNLFRTHSALGARLGSAEMFAARGRDPGSLMARAFL